MQTAFVLIAHGSRDPAWAEPFTRLAHDAGARLAFVEMGSPTVDEAVTRAIAGGARTVKLLPLFMAVGRHVRHDIPASVETLRAAHPDCTIEILPCLGEIERFWAALAEIVRAQMAQTPTGTTAGTPTGTTADTSTGTTAQDSDVGSTRRR
jgi:sirohydrochlorin cobaltochelatase